MVLSDFLSSQKTVTLTNSFPYPLYLKINQTIISIELIAE